MIIGLIVFLFLTFNWVVFTYTDWLWFTAVDYQQVWLRQWSFRFFSFLIAFVVAALFLLINWHLARRRAIKETPPFNPKFLQVRVVGWLITGLALFLSLGFASTIGGSWEIILRYVYRFPFGETDPIFNQDISFYLFELPLFEQLQQWLISLFVLTILGSFAIYALNNIIDIQRGQWQPQKSNALRRHIALLATVLLALWAIGYIFSLYNLLYSDRGVVFGASFTDLNVSRLALYGQMIAMGVVAAAVFYNIFRFDLRPIAVGGGLWVLVTLVGGGILPGLVQRYSVDPNEIEQETPYIAHNIAFTRMAFNLDGVEVRDFDEISDLTSADFESNQDVLANVRLWDYRPLQTTYEKLQTLRPIYQFNDVDIDRYTIDGQTEQVMLAVRELNKDNLTNDSWVNRNLEFTHGYGIVMNPVDLISDIGQPVFYVEGLPPQSTLDIPIDRPEIYYGELTNDAVFVGSARDEFSYPQGQEPVYSRYQGTGGVLLDSQLKRVAYALRLGEVNVLLNSEINQSTRLQFHRNIQNRILQITPYLQLDTDPYIVIWNGRLLWVQDAYTTSNRFPYSEPTIFDNGSRINYIRNSVKITVDAYTGDVNYYMVDQSDPIIRTYARAFPNLFQPMSDMPDGLQAHIRYPENLFDVQAQQYLKYHITNERVFYNEEDVWNIPNETFDDSDSSQQIEPYYVILTLPGEESSEYLLILPFVPEGRENMVAWMAARNDGEDYGKLVVYELPRQEFVDGPSLIEARISQEPSISQQFSLWDQSGSSIIRGNLLTIPLNNNFLYVEPIYLQSTSDNAVPELQRIVVATSNRIAMEETLEEALASLFEDSAIVVEEPIVEEDDTAVTIEEPVEEIIIDENATVEQLIQSANAHFEAAEQAQREGDWATYGAEIEALQQDLEQLSRLVGE
ncbi:MAG: UPF0182 family protein [Chloroflexota bacterium]